MVERERTVPSGWVMLPVVLAGWVAGALLVTRAEPVAGIGCILASMLLAKGLFTLQPNEARVLVLFVGGRRHLVQTVTAFTVGHSITLSMAALGFVRFPSRPIEVMIAASVFWLAVELARGRDARSSWMRRRPWLMAGSFGLLHGLGFAGALAEAGLPEGEIPLALLSFNLGIEAGQLAFVAVVVAGALAMRRAMPSLPSWALRAPVYAMGSLAAFRCLERIAVLGG